VSDPRLDELWQAVLASWADDDAHLAFLDHCRATEQLGAAAARYREEVEGGDPARAEAAQKRLAGIALLAVLELEARRTSLDDAPSTLTVAVRVVAALALFGISVFAVLRFIAR
jgi:hypothetical protein